MTVYKSYRGVRTPLLKSMPSKQLDRPKRKPAFWARRRLVRGKNRLRTRIRLIRECSFGTAVGPSFDVASVMLLPLTLTITVVWTVSIIAAIMHGCCSLWMTLTTTG